MEYMEEEEGRIKGGNWTKDVVFYWSSVSGNLKSKTETDKIEQLLTVKKIPFNPIDVSMNPIAKEYMKTKSEHPIPTTVPQLFFNGVYLGDWEFLSEANENGDLLDLFGMGELII
eukprot:CAMPEP_0175138700 /NCGR_PEP_ID=MMETSP0087-20121206/10497_1 /TAXON_ID=136419 /ORGANISM="Unknown Unknown, Strain D1" /LENGTH=114 /DNA_ID=CAMNT_0016421637 /DNA_START=1 /DNA_END=345 /DNA_ORIENTATION=+